MSDLVFHPVLSRFWLALAALAVLGMLLWSLRHGLRSRPRMLILGTFRFIALAALVAMLAQPQQRREEITILRPQLAVLVDNTQSMAERVDPGQPTRSARLAEWLRSPALAAAQIGRAHV